jgi:hypothetical protein
MHGYRFCPSRRHGSRERLGDLKEHPLESAGFTSRTHLRHYKRLVLH